MLEVGFNLAQALGSMLIMLLTDSFDIKLLYSVPAMYSKALGSILFKLVTYIFHIYIINKAIVFSAGHVSDINCLSSDI